MTLGKDENKDWADLGLDRAITTNRICRNLMSASTLLPSEVRRYKAVLQAYGPITLVKVLLVSHQLREAHEESREGGSIVDKPKIVCLCGSTRFMDAFVEAYIQESGKGNVVLTVAGNPRGRPDYEFIKPVLDRMYLYKVAMSDEILVLNVGGYVGDSTKREIDYARKLGKRIRWLEEGGSDNVETD